MALLQRLGFLLGLLSLSIGTVRCQSVSEAGDEVTILTGTKATSTPDKGTPTYQTYTSRITLATASTGDISSAVPNVTESVSGDPSETVTYLTGVNPSSTQLAGNGTASVTSSTSARPKPTNTRPCNNYPEFCDRKYSNITEVGCHNSPFVRAGSAAANQALPVIDQLNDGIRFLQAQIQWPANATDGPPHFCHTSCELLDAGPITEWLTTVKDWVAGHPYDVVTILLGNGNYSKPEFYAPLIESTGILQYVYHPPVVPMALDDWPTLGQMILSGQRVVMFMDYEANQTAYPWLLDQFSQMWETPFDPLDQNFPCTVQRPPDLPADQAKNRLYLMNHNLNVQVSLLGAEVVVPAVSQLNQTNNATGFGSVGLAANNCRSDWGRAPNVLNVDFYNYGEYPGSVFEAAARVNNVTYNRPCCGAEASGALGRLLLLREDIARTSVGMVLVWVVFWMLV